MIKSPVELWQHNQIKAEAQLRVEMQEKVQPRLAYRTLFYGLKKNHAHNMAIVHPLAFLLRRVFYALIVVFLVEGAALFGAFLLLATCLVMLTFILVESPWVDQLINT